MGDFLQIVIIIGIIVVALIKQLQKATKEAEQKRQRETYAPEEINEDQIKTFENSPKPFLNYDYEPASTHVSARKAKNTASPPKKAPPQQWESPLLDESPADEQEFNIHSTEEVRRAIIWSEILNRKY